MSGRLRDRLHEQVLHRPGRRLTRLRDRHPGAVEQPIGFPAARVEADRAGVDLLVLARRGVAEFGVQYRPYRERVLQIINAIRKEEGQPPIADR